MLNIFGKNLLFMIQSEMASWTFRHAKQNEITDELAYTFLELLKRQGKVQRPTIEKVKRCFQICIAEYNNVPVAIGAVKPKSPSLFMKEKANIVESSNDFEQELGYLYTEQAFEGRGIASLITKMLLHDIEKENVMASTELFANPRMVRILNRNGFAFHGKSWKSVIHKNDLAVFLKYKK